MKMRTLLPGVLAASLIIQPHVFGMNINGQSANQEHGQNDHASINLQTFLGGKYAKLKKQYEDFGRRCNLGQADIDYNVAHFAASEGLTGLLNDLIGLCNVNALDIEGGWTPLHWAIYAGQPKIAKTLLNFPGQVDVNRQNRDGQTPLLFALLRHNYTMAKDLIKHDAKVSIKAANGASPYTLANTDEHMPTYLKTMIVQTYANQTSLKILMNGKYAHLDQDCRSFCQSRLLGNVDISDHMICFAAYKGLDDLLADFIDRGYDIHRPDAKFGCTPLLWAVMGNRLETATMLLDNYSETRSSLDVQVYINAKNNAGVSPLWVAMDAKNNRLVRLLISHGAGGGQWHPMAFNLCFSMR